MSGAPVTIVTSGGMPVTAVDSGAPIVTAVESGGLPITLVDSGGLPFVVDGRFSPSELFADSEQGVWLDPGDLSTLWQDSAGTVPAVVDGPVGRVDDKSGNGKHAVQATAANRPMLRRTNGFYHLEFDGVNDWLATPAINLAGTNKASMWIAVADLTATTHMIAELGISTDGTPGTFCVYVSAGSAYFVARGDSGAPQRAAVLPSSAVLSVAYDLAGATGPDEVKPRINGAVPTITEAAAGPAGGGNFTSNPLYIGQRNFGSDFPMNGNFYGLIMRGAATDAADTLATEEWLNAKVRAF